MPFTPCSCALGELIPARRRIVTHGTEGNQEVDEQQITVGGQQFAFQPNPAMAFTFAPSISPDEARAYSPTCNTPAPGLTQPPRWSIVVVLATTMFHSRGS